jgi:arsenate reductase
MTITTRIATPADAPAIAAIYNEGIEDRVATLETAPRSPENLAEWFEGKKVIVVAEAERNVVGAAWTSPTSARRVYSRNAEASVYVRRDARGRGVGRAALHALVEETRRRGMWKLVAGIFPENAASIRLFTAYGFREVGRQEAHGQLDGIFRDVVLMERIVAPTVLFACVHNAGRSQMSAALFNAAVAAGKARAISAGTKPGPAVHPVVVDAMRELGLELSRATPQHLSEALARTATLLVTMGCGEACPVVPGLRREDWPIEDPKGLPIERVREIRDDLRRRIEELLAREGLS